LGLRKEEFLSIIKIDREGIKMSEVALDYWQLVQRKGDKLLVLLGKPQKPKIKKVVTGYLFVIIGLLIIAFLWISTQIYVTSMGYTISSLQKEMHRLENLQRMLLVDISSLRAAERIEKMATKMGLIIPDKVEVIYLPKPNYITKKEEKTMHFFNLGIKLFKRRQAEAFEFEVKNKKF
jgi:cell division protein FtsL